MDPKYIVIGAGGGGDTTAALLYAISLKDFRTEVLGAGYSYQEYVKSINDGVINGRLPYRFHGLIIHYLNSILTKVSSDQYEIYRIDNKENTIELRDQLFNPLRFDITKTIEESNASFKYRSLIEEGLIKRYFNNDIDIFMCYTTDKYEIESIKKMYWGIVEHIKKDPNCIIKILDFGGDIFDFNKSGRDIWFLLLVLHMIKNIPEFSKIIVEVDVYGPGIDAHDIPSKAYETILSYVKLLNGFSFIPETKFIKLFEDHQEFLTNINILGKGRATGNYIYANSPNFDVKVFIDEYLKARPEYKKINREEFDKNCDTWIKTPLATQYMFSSAYRFIFSKNNNNIKTIFDIVKQKLNIDFNDIIYDKLDNIKISTFF